jgi:thiol-disulfide isomerase/thioredoxin
VKIEDCLKQIRKMDAMASSLKFPDLADSLTWFNSRPLRKEDFQGKLLVVDFWTYCCINCLHTLPHLKKLEEKYHGKPVLFLGIHSPKFANEKNDDNLRKAILRYEVTHPVVNDPNLSTWKEIGVRAWPTLMLVGPKGNCLFSVSGEGKTHELNLMIEAALEYYQLKQETLPIQSSTPRTNSFLYFPGKVAVDDRKELLFISDSGNNRIVITTFNGKVVDILENCDLNHPQGLCYSDEKLFIADTENHLIRCADLKEKTVTTIVGTGVQGFDFKGGKRGVKQSISSPWDLVLRDGILYIAMAGTHQIWTYDLSSDIAANFSGTGQELHLNSEEPMSAAWAQPSGLSLGNDKLYIADSESSSIRCINMKSGKTTTLAGADSNEPRDLFCFGDRIGASNQALFQHPLAVLWLEKTNELLIADTYNHKIKSFKNDVVQNFATDGFNEPSGLCFSEKKNLVFVADTNNHRICVIDPLKKTTTTLEIYDPQEKGLSRVVGI